MPRVQRFFNVDVGVVLVQIVPYNKQRTGILIRNTGPATAFLSNDQTDLLDTGYPLASGEFVAFLSADGDVPELQLYAVTAAAAADLRIVETFGEVTA